MRENHRILLGFLAARLAFGLTFLVSFVGHWMVPWYFPLAHRWELVRQPEGLAMDWYGRSALSLLVGVVAGGVVYLIVKVPAAARVMGRASFITAFAHFGALLLFTDVVFYVLMLVTRELTPTVLPAWYCPR